MGMGGYKSSPLLGACDVSMSEFFLFDERGSTFGFLKTEGGEGVIFLGSCSIVLMTLHDFGMAER